MKIKLQEQTTKTQTLRAEKIKLRDSVSPWFRLVEIRHAQTRLKY